MKSIAPYILIIILLFIIWFKGCKGKDDVHLSTVVTEIDTIEVIKYIPSKDISIKDPKPEYIYKYPSKDKIDSLVNKVNSLKEEKDKVTYLLRESKKLIKKLEKKDYDTTYEFDGGSLSLKETVEGIVLDREFDIYLDSIPYKEFTVTKTIKKYPKWVISGGVNTGFTFDNDLVSKPYIGGGLGFRNQKGYEFSLYYNTRKQAEFRLSKDIFVHYAKDK